MANSLYVPRRTFLRGVGTLMALPFLESLQPTSALGAGGKLSAGGNFPRRLAFIYVPNGANLRRTRPVLIQAFELCASKRDSNPPRKHGNIPL